MSKRLFDLFFSILGILALSPFFLIISGLVVLTSSGPAFFRQWRVGKNNIDFQLLKFRTMYQDAEKRGQLTVGLKDSRITPFGHFLRKYKLDELPQLINVILGEMSLVGPRPEVRRYVELYTPEQKQVLSVRPGITDLASIQFRDENALLEKAKDPEQYYIKEVMPRKLLLNLEYVKNHSIIIDLRLILKTFFYLFRKRA